MKTRKRNILTKTTKESAKTSKNNKSLTVKSKIKTYLSDLKKVFKIKTKQ